jgi:CHAT domain-containing protein
VNDVSECPDLESLAALIEGRLEQLQAQSLRAHLAGCQDCFHVVSESLHVLSHEKALPAPVPRPVWWALAAAAVAVVVAGAWWFTPRDLTTQLARAVGERRPVEARLIGGFLYAPPETALRGEPSGSSVHDDWRVLRVVSQIDARAGGDAPSAASLQASGVAALVLGRHDRAVASLEAADRHEPGNPRVLSDLSAAYLARADSTGSAEDRVRAADAAQHAIALDPRLPEARFNLAIALEKQALDTPGVEKPDAERAIRAWNDYLALDASSPWASEARRRLEHLAEKRNAETIPTGDAVEAAAKEGDSGRLRTLLAVLPRVGRDVLEKRLLPAWAEATLAGNRDEAVRLLETSRILAAALSEVTRDPLARETAASIGAIASDPRKAARLARSLLEYRDGIRLHDQDRMAEATPHFTAAGDGFADLGMPLRWSARLYLAIAEYYEGHRVESERLVSSIETAIGERACPSLAARVLSMKGLLHGVRGDLSGALVAYESARDQYAATGEPDGTARTDFLIAETLGYLGDREDAWKNRARAVAAADRVPADRRSGTYLEASYAALNEGLPWAALGFLEPAFDRSSDLSPGDRAELHLTRARIEEGLHDARAASSDLEAARRLNADVLDSGLRDRFNAERALARGVAGREADQEQALTALQEALAYFEKENAASRIPEVELETGLALERLGRMAEAESHYEAGLAALNRSHESLEDEARRIDFFDRSAELVDALIGIEATALANPDRALEFAERARRAELGLVQETPSGPMAIPAALRRQDVPPTAILSFVVLKTQILRWVSAGSGWVFRPSPEGADSIQALVSELQAAIASRDDERFLRSSARLYDALLRPVDDLFPARGELRIVPDRSLGAVPFAALYDPRSGRYLAERFAVAVAPSLSFSGRDEMGAARGRAGRLLVVSDPAFDQERFPGLERLPEAAVEGREIVRESRDAVLLSGADATPARVLREAGGAAVLHFGGHAFVNERAPLFSALVLAPEAPDESTGLLTVGALRRAELPNLRLVVLGACRAGAGGRSRSAGAFGLSRPFLMAGVPEIVAPLWAVRDREASSLLTAFHHGLGLGRTPVESLHEAQLAALRNGDSLERSPIAWGAFEVNSTILN